VSILRDRWRWRHDPDGYAGPLPVHRLARRREAGELSPAALHRWHHGSGAGRPAPRRATAARDWYPPGPPPRGPALTPSRGQRASAHVVRNRDVAL